MQVVEQRSERHERRDEHHLSRDADSHDTDAARMHHWRHDARLLQQLRVRAGIRTLAQLLYCDHNLYVLTLWDVNALQQTIAIYRLMHGLQACTTSDIVIFIQIHLVVALQTHKKQEVWLPGSADTVCFRPPVMTQVQHFISQIKKRQRACLGGTVGSVVVRAAWLRWSASLGSRPRLARSLCQVIAAYALRLNSRAGTEGSTVSSLICDRWLILGLETLIISRCLNHW